MRLFIGIPLPVEVVNELYSIAKPLSSEFSGFRWSAPESWHITLQFLGSTSQEAHTCVTAKLREIRSPAIQVRLGGFDSFVRSGVFLAGVVVTPGLEALQQRVSAATAPCGFEPEARPYHPHITLARSKREGNPKQLRAITSRVARTPFQPQFLAQEFVLYESFTGGERSRYEIRERFPLVAA